jgi:hypothetical protein
MRCICGPLTPKMPLTSPTDQRRSVIVGTQVVESYDVTQRVRAVNSRSYYDADERLRAFQQYDTDFSGNKGSGVWEEYRYDPLGRRVLVRTRRENPLCYGDAKTCISSVTRFVWSGDQILWELKEATGSYAADAGGRVSYAHAGGIDRPLAIWKQGVGTLVTHQNWRGQFSMGTYTSGQPSDCQQYPPSGCVPVSWPGWGITAWHEKAGTAPTTGYEHYWMGSLAVGMRDASGQMYMRTCATATTTPPPAAPGHRIRSSPRQRHGGTRSTGSEAHRCGAGCKIVLVSTGARLPFFW